MSDGRSLPPTPRRRAAALAAGQVPHSPALTAAAAALGALVGAAASISGGAAAWTSQLRQAIAVAGDDGRALQATPSAADVTLAVTALAAPILLGAFLAGAVAHVAQTRRLLVPRRTLPDAPRLPTSATSRLGDALLALAGATTLAGFVIAWLLHEGPSLARAGHRPPAQSPDAVARSLFAVVAPLAGALGIAALAARTFRLRAALRMTPSERHAEARSSGPTASRRAAPHRSNDDALDGHARHPAHRDLALATCIVIGADVAVALAAAATPRVLVIAAGADAAALVLAARRRGLPVIPSPVLASSLRGVGEADVPPNLWPVLAEAVADLTTRPAPATARSTRRR